MDLTLVTCLDMPQPDLDEQPLLDALAGAGIEARVAAWDDPAVDWNETKLTVIRSTWNYTADRDAFLAWARTTSAAKTTLRNSLSAIVPNTHKSYLATLERNEVPVVPTRWFMRGGTPGDADAIRSLPWERVVAKPAVGAGSVGVRAFDLTRDDEIEAAAAHVTALQATGDVLVQPRLASIADEGERNVVWIGGDFTHTVRKRERLDGDDPGVVGVSSVSDDEQRLARRALRTLPAFANFEVLYARVDMATDELGDLRVVELELVEPYLFLTEHEPAMEQMVAALVRDCAR
ncbi:MAG: ATP-grasp protein [Thermoleophilia bacterium]|nr:ATP-grasp protein [Thermoleophilia bacterium]